MLTPLKLHREKQNLVSREVALALKITPSHYRRIEIGETRASPAVANRIAKYFGNAVTRDQILFPEDYVESDLPPKKPLPQRLRKAS
jgi:transcriptional regulator with XRE-family HTH domain